MKLSPADIIVITVSRYLPAPTDRRFRKEYSRMVKPVPANVLALLERTIDLELIEKKPMLKGDLLLVSYIRSLDRESDSFPVTETLREYQRVWFTPVDNDFYNRVIYEKEIEQLKQVNAALKRDAELAIRAKLDFIMRDYELVKPLGDGGFGLVSLVRHKVSNGLYAIKRLHSASPEDQKHILREIKALEPLDHTNIVRYQHSFYSGTYLYLVMEYCPGGSLAGKIRIEGNMEEGELARNFLELTAAFAYIHGKGIVHRDIKPENILFNAEGVVKIGDFGCANTSMGTQAYYAPELHHSATFSSDPRTDIFSLGVTLMECALGFNPFLHKSPDEKVQMLNQARLPIRHLSFWLQEVIYKAVSVDLNVRFQSMAEFHRALEQKNIPEFLSPNIIRLEKDASRLNRLINTRKWMKAGIFISTHSEIEKNLNLLIGTGNYYLKTHQVDKAQNAFEKALQINPQAGIAKQIAEIYLRKGEVTKANAILVNYLSRNFRDLEGHNQLLHGYFLGKRWKLGQDQASGALDIFPGNQLLYDNWFLFRLLNGDTNRGMYERNSPFVVYNRDMVVNNEPPAWSTSKKPFLYTKLLFHEYCFNKISEERNTIEIYNGNEWVQCREPIIPFGRKGYVPFVFSGFSSNSVSRLHFAIINQKNNVWLYDLGSTSGVFVDGRKVEGKCFLQGLQNVTFANEMILVKSDTDLLI